LALQLNPHVAQVVRIILCADQAYAGDGGDDENTNGSEYNHGDLLSPISFLLYIFNAVRTLSLHFSYGIVMKNRNIFTGMGGIKRLIGKHTHAPVKYSESTT
jgi:hypothetical protein